MDRPRAVRTNQSTMNTFIRLGFVCLVVVLADSTTVAADSGVTLEQSEKQLRVTWPMSPDESGVAVFSLDEKKPLIESLGVAAKGQPATVVMRALNPVTLLTVGSRDSKNPQGWGAFFDNTPKRPYETFLIALGKRRVQTTNNGTRITVSLAEASGGGFRGDVRFTFYRNSPILHVETVLTTQEDWRAIIYDAGPESPAPSWQSMGWNDTNGKFQSVKYAAQAAAEPLAVAGRTIVASAGTGSLAVFPAPHQFFYPQDEAYNLKFVWHGGNYTGRVTDYASASASRTQVTGDSSLGSTRRPALSSILAFSICSHAAMLGRRWTPSRATRTATVTKSCRAI